MPAARRRRDSAAHDRRAARRAAVCGGREPAARGPRCRPGLPGRQGSGGRAVRRLQAAHPALGGAGQHWRGRHRGGRLRARRHRFGCAVRRARGLPRRAARRRGALPDRGARHGQVRGLRAELRQRRRRDLRRRPRRAQRRYRDGDGRGNRRRPGDGRRAAHGHQARDRPDRGVLTDHPGRHDLPDRPEPAARRAQRPAGPHPGQPYRLLRAMGQDVGVPGPAEGPPGGR